MKFEIDMDDDFIKAFTTGGSPNASCSCGREHVSMLQYDYWDADPNDPMDIANIKTNYEEMAVNDDFLILDYEFDSFELMEVSNHVFVVGCECEGWRPYMNFMINERKNIAQFLISTSVEIKRVQSYEDVMTKLEEEYV